METSPDLENGAPKGGGAKMSRIFPLHFRFFFHGHGTPTQIVRFACRPPGFRKLTPGCPKRTIWVVHGRDLWPQFNETPKSGKNAKLWWERKKSEIFGGPGEGVPISWT